MNFTRCRQSIDVEVRWAPLEFSRPDHFSEKNGCIRSRFCFVRTATFCSRAERVRPEPAVLIETIIILRDYLTRWLRQAALYRSSVARFEKYVRALEVVLGKL